ncbi:MAG: hydrolase, partial [Propionibacteriaceae bacterium]|nr:hydrolase [Propionibacteriaceae bacterium]
MIPTRAQAEDLVRQYNTQEFHVHHARVVAGVMAWFAQQYDPDNVDFWYAVGMLHDIDYEMYPDEHCVKGSELLDENGVDPAVIRSAMSHGWGMTGSPYQPESMMEKILFACDELTGFIGAVAVVRPSKS